MTKQEAYARACELLKELDALSKEHDLVIGLRDRDALPEALDPDLYEVVQKSYTNYRGETVTYNRYHFKKDMTDEQLAKLAKAFDETDIEWVKDQQGEDVYAGWVPSQYC